MSKPKILHLDIETAPATAYVWKMFDETIGLDQLITPGRIICWAAKWHGGEMFAADERKGKKQMLARMHALMAEADAIVTFNGDKFDLPKLNGEFLAVGLPSLPPTPSIDLRRTTKRLGYISGKLMFVSGHLGIGAKIDTGGFKLWRDVLDGDERAWAKMIRYNKHDVVLLERLYKRVLPYIKTHPALHQGHGSCPVCGASKVQRRGNRRTKAFMIERLHCQGCGSWFDGRRMRLR